MGKSSASIWVDRFFISVVCCGILLGNAPILRSEPSSNSIIDANALVARMLEVNKPWLHPRPSQGTYSLLRKVRGTGDGEKLGPYPFVWKSRRLGSTEWKQYANRVGSEVWTPLHVMVNATTNIYSGGRDKSGI